MSGATGLVLALAVARRIVDNEGLPEDDYESQGEYLVKRTMEELAVMERRRLGIEDADS